MEYFNNLLIGFSVILQPINLFYCFIGCLVGTIIGILPGIGPVGTIAILLPSTFNLSPVTAIIMLAGIYYGAMYGGSTTSILLNIPGEAASVVTCLDGYQMAKHGRAGPALGISALGSFIGGTLSIIFMIFLVFPLAEMAIKFGPPEYFGMIIMGLTLVTYLTKGHLLKAFVMVLIGLLLGCVGTDLITGKYRFTIGVKDLIDGVPLVPMVMGLFGVGEVLNNLGNPNKISFIDTKVKDLLPNLEDWKKSIGPILRGTFLGFGLGIIPGGGSVLASFIDYTVEKRISKNPERFGNGAIEGVAGPETANNAACTGSFIPLLALGIPSNVVIALLLGALLIHGITPGPLFIQKNPDIFWGLIASMYFGNVMLLILNLPMIPLWVKLLRIPYAVLFPLILLFCLIGVYSINNNIFDIFVMILCGVAGYFLNKFQYEFAPLVLAFILGPMLENSFRQSLIISNGSFWVFIQKPVSAICIGLSFILLATSAISFVKKIRGKVAE